MAELPQLNNVIRAFEEGKPAFPSPRRRSRRASGRVGKGLQWLSLAGRFNITGFIESAGAATGAFHREILSGNPNA